MALGGEASVARQNPDLVALVQASPDAIVVIKDGRHVYANQRALQLYRARDVAELAEKPALDYMAPDLKRVGAARLHLMTEERRQLDYVDEAIIRLDGTRCDIEVGGSPIVFDGEPAALVVMRDITDRKQVQKDLAQARAAALHAEQRLAALVEYSANPIFVVDEAGRLRYANPATEQLVGERIGQRAGAVVADLVHPADLHAVTERLADISTVPGQHAAFTFRITDGAGGWLHLETVGNNQLSNPAIRGIVINARDVSQRVALESELQRQALHDSLTGLPNRALILDRLSQLLSGSSRRFSRVAALFIDLDNFKDINDSLGHAAGDELLRAVAARLSTVMRGEDTVGRLGGDEFVVLAEQSGTAESASLIAQRIVDIFAEPFDLGSAPDMALSVRASIGIAIGASDVPGDLLRDADVALYRAKAAGKNCYVVFDPDMQADTENRLQMAIELRDALQRGEFFLVYQPVIDLLTMQTYGVEALLRWNRPGHAAVGPAEFVPMLEQDGFILDIGRWVLAQACMQGAEWERRGTPLTVSVNASALQLIAGSFVDHVREALTQSGFDPARLVIEITESVLMREPATTVTALHALHELGVRIAIDDFGTGYSSLSYLRQFPIDALKIDQSFVADMEQSAEAATLVRTLVRLGKELGITTTAEGIEDTNQLLALQASHCESGQGFLIARPMPADEITAFVRTWRHTHAHVAIEVLDSVRSDK